MWFHNHFDCLWEWKWENAHSKEAEYNNPLLNYLEAPNKKSCFPWKAKRNRWKIKYVGQKNYHIKSVDMYQWQCSCVLCVRNGDTWFPTVRKIQFEHENRPPQTIHPPLTCMSRCWWSWIIFVRLHFFQTFFDVAVSFENLAGQAPICAYFWPPLLPSRYTMLSYSNCHRKKIIRCFTNLFGCFFHLYKNPFWQKLFAIARIYCW